MANTTSISNETERVLSQLGTESAILFTNILRCVGHNPVSTGHLFAWHLFPLLLQVKWYSCGCTPKSFTASAVVAVSAGCWNPIYYLCLGSPNPSNSPAKPHVIMKGLFPEFLPFCLFPISHARERLSCTPSAETTFAHLTLKRLGCLYNWLQCLKTRSWIIY